MPFEAKNLAIIIIISLAIATVDSFENVCRKAKVFRKNHRYLYKYSGVVENGIKGASNNTARMKISAMVVIDFVNRCEYSMQLQNIQLEESFGGKDGYKLSSESDTMAKTLQRFPLRFMIDNGIVTKVRPVIRERRKDVLNIKRGILSAFQVKWSKKRTVTESDISGICNVGYDVKRYKNGTKHVKKVKDLTSCQKRTFAHSNIETVQYKQVSSIYDEKSTCSYHLKKKNEIETVNCNEYYLVKPFSSINGAGSYTNITQFLQLHNVMRIRSTKYEHAEVYSTSLLFEHRHEENSKSSDASNTIRVLNQLVEGGKSSGLIGSRFAELVYAFRSVNEHGLGKLLPQLKTCFSSPDCDETKLTLYRSFFFDALAQCGTGSCVNILATLITSKKIPVEKVGNTIIALNFIQDPTPSMINAVMAMYTSSQNPTILLLLGTLMHKLCQHRPSSCQEKGTIRNVINDADFFLMRLLGNDCRNEQRDRNEIIYHTLKAIGNAGRPVQMTDVIIDCLKHAVDTKISIAAIHALRRMPLSNDVTDALRTIIIDRNVDPERRIESFLLLMSNPTEADIILAIDMVNDEREAHQVRSFVNSFLSTWNKTKDPSKTRLTELFRKALKEKKPANFNPTPTKFSKFNGNSFFLDYFEAGAGFSQHTIFHPESFIPRTIKLSLHAQILGHSVDVLEVNARMEGLERHVNKIIGDNGYISKEFFKNMFEIPGDFGQQKKSRERRNVWDDSFWKSINHIHKLVNMKGSVPDMALSIKIFGNEIKILKLEDIPLFNGDLDEFNLLKTLYSLTKGKSASFQRSTLFLEGNYIVPTVVGLPLAFEINGSAAFSLQLNGKAKVSNLIFGLKNVELKGSASPSVSLDVSGKVTVYGISSKAGLRFHSSAHASNRISGEVNYKNENQLTLKIDSFEGSIDLFNYSHKMFHVLGKKELPISGSRKRAKLNICTEEVSSMSKYIGIDICAGLNFPVAYHDIDAPFYPLSGPAAIGFRLKKTDSSFKIYLLDVLRSGDFIRILFDTPGSSLPRMTTVKLGVTPFGQKGVVGATFGNSSKGLLFNYEYDNNTHGLTTNFRWNFTGNDVIVSANYFNETDPATLDLKLGIEISVMSSYLKGITLLNFIDTYGFWGIDWLIDFGKTPFKSELKIAYNPQTVFARIAYGDKNFAVQLVPSYPVISYDMQINWPPTYVNFTVKADLNERKLTVITNTSLNSYIGEIDWAKRNGIQNLIMTAKNGENVFTWRTLLDYKSRSKLIGSRFNLNGREFGLKFDCNESSVKVKIDGFPAELRANLFQTSFMKGVKMSANIASSFTNFILYFKRMKTNERLMCGEADILHMKYGVCISSEKHGGEESVKLDLLQNDMKLSSKFVHSKQKLRQMESIKMKNIYMLENSLNDVQWFVTKCEFEKSTEGERLSSIFVSIPTTNVTIDLNIPNYVLLKRRENTTGSVKLKYGSKEEQNLLQLSIASSRMSDDDSEVTLDARFARKWHNCTEIVSYTQKNGRNDRTKAVDIRRKILTVSCDTIRLYEDWFTMEPSIGHAKWQFKYKISNMSSVPIGNDVVFITNKHMRSVDPVTSFYADIYAAIWNKNEILLYPRQFGIDHFGNRFYFKIDKIKQTAKLGLKLAQMLSVVKVRFNETNKFELLIDYAINSTNFNKTKIILEKADKHDKWKITIRNPCLKNLIGGVRSIYQSNFERYQLELVEMSKKFINGLKLSEKAKGKILHLILLASLPESYMNNATVAIKTFASKWKKLIKEIIREQFEAVSHIKSSSKMASVLWKNGEKSFMAVTEDFLSDIVALDRLKFIIEKNLNWKNAVISLMNMTNSEEFKEVVMKVARKTFEARKIPQETLKAIMSMLNMAMNDLKLSMFLPNVLVKLFGQHSNTTLKVENNLVKSLFDNTLHSLNMTQEELLESVSNDEKFIEFMKDELRTKTSLNKMVKDVSALPIGSGNVSNFLHKLASLSDFIINVNTTGKGNLLEAGKEFLQEKLRTIVEYIPDPWKARVSPILNDLIAAIKSTKDEKLISNATEVLFKIGEKVFNSVYGYVSMNLSSDIHADLTAVINDFLPNVMIGNLSLPHYWTRTSNLVRERFFFGLRMAAQMFPRKVEHFKKEYIRNNDILIAKIYKDIVGTNLTAQENTKIITTLLSNGAKWVFSELAHATGNFSTGTSLLNLLKFIQGVDFDNLDSVIQSYERVKRMSYDGWSIPAVLQHFKDILKNFGKMKFGNETVNHHIVPMIHDFNSVIPNIIKESKAYDQLIKAAFRKTVAYVREISRQYRTFISQQNGKLADSFSKWEKVFKFASALTTPVFDTTRKMVNMKLKKEKDVEKRLFLQKLIGSLIKYDQINMTDFVLNLFENDDDRPPEEALKSLLKKITEAIENVEKKARKKLKVMEKIITSNQRQLRNILKQVKGFLHKKSTQPLHKIIQKAGKHVIKYVKSSYANSTFINDLQLDFGPIYNFKNIRLRVDTMFKNATKTLEQAFDSLDDKDFKEMANSNLRNVLRNWVSKAANSLMVILKHIDMSKEAVLAQEYLRNPKESLMKLPQVIMMKWKQQLDGGKDKLFYWISQVESSIKRNVFKESLLKRESLRRILSHLEHIHGDIKNLDYYAIALKLSKQFEKEGILRNYTSKVKEGRTYVQKRLRDVLEGKEWSYSNNGKTNELRKNDTTDGEVVKVISALLAEFEASIKIGIEGMSEELQKGWTTEGMQKEVYRIIRKIDVGMKKLGDNINNYINIVFKQQITFFVDGLENLQNLLTWDRRLVEKFFAASSLQHAGLERMLTHLLMKGFAVKHLHNETMQLKNEKVDSFGGSGLRIAEFQQNLRNPVLETTLESLFKKSHKLVDLSYLVFTNVTQLYQMSLQAMHSDLNEIVQSIYIKTFMEPLKRISAATTIPVPAEKLQSFLDGRNSWKRAGHFLKPSPAVATIFNGHIITYDGNYVYLPSVKNSLGCTYLLSRDFQNGIFTFSIKDEKFHISIGQVTIVISRYEKLEIFSLNRGKESNNLPTEVHGILIKTTGQTVNIAGPFGLQITCNKQLFFCDFKVPGIFHNKTLGIFGSNNAEFADDFKMPNGRITVDLLSFINSWKMAGNVKCQDLQRGDFLSKCSTTPSQKCIDSFKDGSSFSKAFSIVNPLPYLLACQQETAVCDSNEQALSKKYCVIASLYVKRVLAYGMKLKLPAECAVCRINNSLSTTKENVKLKSQSNMVDIVLIVRDSLHSKKMLHNLKYMLGELDKFLMSLKINVGYTLVGFGGVGYRRDPYVQTGIGRASGDIRNLIAAIGNLQYKSTLPMQNGLDALKYASSQLSFRPFSSKIFVMVDTVASYSGSLRAMIETNNMLMSKAIILNAINKYKFKKNVIAQASSNVRYHLKIPNGEKLRNLFFHTSDDYVPIVKESGGALMTAKGLISSNEKWMKAFPISFNQIIFDQIENDRSKCKSCSCTADDFGFSQFHCINSIENKC